MATLEELSTGQVAGIIAAGIFVVNILFKLIWPLITVALTNMNESAATWTKVAASIQSSLWPTLLRSDSTVSDGVKMSIRFTTKLGTLSTLLLSLASIITPLGLYEAIVANPSLDNVEFAYARDSSVFGVGTLPRPAEGHSRVCGSIGPAACPNSGSVIESSRNETGIFISDQDVINVNLDPKYVAYLQSGAKAIGPMVSSIFDIDFRTYTYKTDARLATTNGGKKYPAGDFSQFDTLFLDEDYHVVEGLIVDMKLGSIGFRNHTIPTSGSRWGTEWTEDILFIEPQTACVDTNLTFEWSVPLDSLTTSVENLVLVDNGGFTNMNHTFPELETFTAQDDPQLSYRAYRSAWFQNAYTALYYNVTNPGPSISGMKSFSYINSELGKQFPQTQLKSGAGESTWLRKQFSVSGFGDYIKDLPSDIINGTSNSSSTLTLNLPDNPWQITTSNFTEAQDACNAVFGSSRGNISNILGVCGTSLGVPQEKGTQSVVRFEPGTAYVQPLFGCASVMRAVIKTVSFKYNGTGLAGLTVSSIQEKQYNDEQSWPLWGVETADLRMRDGAPLWGIIAEEQREQFANMTFSKKPHLYLPGWASSSGGSGLSAVLTGQNLAGSDFFTDALAFAYAVGSNEGEAFDYSGRNSLGVYNRWKNMSNTVEGTAHIINLIWADAAANSVVGTKSWVPGAGTLTKRQQASPSSPQALVPVRRYTRRVRYHLAYAIPAFIVLAVFGSALGMSVVLAVFGEGTPGRMKVFLMKTSVGRVMASLLHPDTVTAAAPPKIWGERLGRMHIDFVGPVPRSAATGQHPAAMHSDVYDPILVKGSGSIGLQEVRG